MPKFTRIPYDVEAYRVTKGNLEYLVNFSTVPNIGFRSDLTENKDGILVRGVGTLQSAYVGDWVVRLESGHIETLTDRKFNSRYKLAFVPECSDGCGYQPVSNEKVGTSPKGIGADTAKTVGNTNSSDAQKSVKDIQFWGDGDTFQLICKASSKQEGWLKSTKAMDVGTGVVVQVTTQQRNPDGSYAVAEALTFVPGAMIVVDGDSENGVTARRIVRRTDD
jgi:hypothetical protein